MIFFAFSGDLIQPMSCLNMLLLTVSIRKNESGEDSCTWRILYPLVAVTFIFVSLAFSNHTSKNCLINQREVGHSTHSFSNALRSALREDPDVILVGEMRDLETIQLALTAAETGHLVLSTLHTSSAVKTIDRIIDVFPSGQKSQIRSMLSESLVAIIAQKLLQNKEGNGRIPASEMMIANPAIRNLIREDKIYQIPSLIQAGSQEGMHSLDQDLQRLLSQGSINREDALQIAEDPDNFQKGIF